MQFWPKVFGEEMERGKPHPDPYLAGLKLLDITADEALAFEDSPTGSHPLS